MQNGICHQMILFQVERSDGKAWEEPGWEVHDYISKSISLFSKSRQLLSWITEAYLLQISPLSIHALTHGLIHTFREAVSGEYKYQVPLRFDNNNIIIPPSLDTSSKSLEKVIYSQKPQLVTSAPIIAKKIQPRTLQALSMIAEMSDSEYAIRLRGTYCCVCTVWGVPRSFHMHVKN